MFAAANRGTEVTSARQDGLLTSGLAAWGVTFGPRFDQLVALATVPFPSMHHGYAIRHVRALHSSRVGRGPAKDPQTGYDRCGIVAPGDGTVYWAFA
jgi:hypothetical protein